MTARYQSSSSTFSRNKVFEFRLSTKVTGAKKMKNGVQLTVEPAAGGDAQTIKADVVLLSIGRVPYTEGLGLDAVGVETDARGVIQVDAHFQTNVPGIYAIGDCIPGPMLAHKAEDEGVVVAEILAGSRATSTTMPSQVSFIPGWKSSAR